MARRRVWQRHQQHAAAWRNISSGENGRQWQAAWQLISIGEMNGISGVARRIMKMKKRNIVARRAL